MTVIQLLRLGLLVYVAVTFVVLGDTAGKLLLADGVSPFVVAWSRFFIGAMLLFPLSGLSSEHHTTRLRSLLTDWRVVLRGGFIAAGVACILTALRTEPLANVFGAFFIGPVLLLPLALSSATPTLTSPIMLLFLLSAAASAAGNYLLVIANRRADASLIAPLVYTQLISATLAGLFVFDELPDRVALIGLSLILLSCLGSLYARQR